jgi:predicted GH43/DUF377 family glycosyl hydrolase
MNPSATNKKGRSNARKTNKTQEWESEGKNSGGNQVEVDNKRESCEAGTPPECARPQPELQAEGQAAQRNEEPLEHYETRLKVIQIPRKDLLPNNFAYNPSILEVDNTIFMAYRYQGLGMSFKNTAIGLCELDSKWRVKPGSNRKVELIRRQVNATTFDDPRLFSYFGKPYLTYVNGMLMVNGKWASSIYLADLNETLHNKTYLSQLPRIGDNLNAASVNAGKVACEKNWTPFELGGKMYFVYTINPLVVVEYDVVRDLARQVSSTSFDQSFWKHGEFLAGGTPLLERDGELCGFFHSFTNDDPANPTQRTYHVGFWAMNTKPPFKVTRMSSVPFMTAKKDPKRDIRNANAPWLPNCIFPCGLVEKFDKIYISQGWQDCSCEIIETSWKAAEERVINVK